MPSLLADKLGFAWSDQVPLFESARFHLVPGWTGLVGENGAGKSTLLALLAGSLAPTSGRVRIEPANARIVTCAQEVTRAPDGLLELATSRDGAARALLGRLGLDPAQVARWPTLSSGERKRWQIACALTAAPDILLLDEPGNHLDAAARSWLLDALALFTGIGVVVSHDRALLDALTDTTLRVHGGRVTSWTGGYSAARAGWEASAANRRGDHARLQEGERESKRRLGDSRRVNASAESQRSAGARMKNRHDRDASGMLAQNLADWASARIGRTVQLARKAHDRAARLLRESEFETERGRAVFLAFEPCPTPWLLTLDVPGIRAGDAEVCGPVNVAVGRTDRIRVAGPNGAGKTSLLTALLQGSRLPPERLLWIPQELPAGQGDAWLREVRALPGHERGSVMQLVAALGVDPVRLLASEAPSPGEARKLGIALGLGRKVWIAVLDEPTNHLDLPSVERLQDALAGWPGALVLVSHDETFAAACTHTEWQVSRAGVRT